MNLTKQQRKVANYIWQHRGCTTKDIQRDTGITCPSGRITELRHAGVKIVSIGTKKYSGSKAFECYAIELPTPVPPKKELPAEQLSLV
jgi:Helix-turn-helix domain